MQINSRSARPTTSGAWRLLTCGVVAGPLLVVVSVVQAATRSGFDPSDHPASLLTRGGAGLIQVGNFVVAGALFVASAVGMHRVLSPGVGWTWGPRLIGVMGASLMVGGVFVPDRAYGFPPGTPEGAADEVTWHGVVHAITTPVGFLSLTAASFVFARRYGAQGQRAWARLSGVVGVSLLGLSAWPNLGRDPEGRLLPLWVALALGTGWASAVAAQIKATATVSSSQ